jgi:hypothetical protein
LTRRYYHELDSVEKSIIEFALPRDTVSRDEVLEHLSERHTKTSLKEAFSELSEEDRLYRVGNRADHILIRRDLF